MSFWQKILAFFGIKQAALKLVPVVSPPKEEIPKPVTAAPIVSPSTPPLTGAKPGPRRINAEGMALVEQFEGLDLHAYLDSVRVATIAWGRIKYDDGSSVKMGDTCTREQANQWLQEDLEKDGGIFVRHYFPSLNDDE